MEHVSHTTITLDDDGLVDAELAGDQPGWWIDGNVVSIQTEHTLARYRLPKGRPRVSIHMIGKGRAQLIIGGFTTTTVAVNGPIDTIRKLREEVL